MSRYSFVRSLFAIERSPVVIITDEQRIKMEILAIAEPVAAKWKVGLHDVIKGVRRRPVAWARQDATRLAYETGRYSLSEIGRVFNRDHTSILHGIRRSMERAQ